MLGQRFLHFLLAIVMNGLIGGLDVRAQMKNVRVKRISIPCAIFMNARRVELRQEFLAVTQFCILLIEKGHVHRVIVVAIVDQFVMRPTGLV